MAATNQLALRIAPSTPIDAIMNAISPALSETWIPSHETQPQTPGKHIEAAIAHMPIETAKAIPGRFTAFNFVSTVRLPGDN
jgi:hypothetical protein